jgi:hypothetical protein
MQLSSYVRAQTMDQRLRQLIADYQQTVANKFEQIRSELGIPAPSTNMDWAANGLRYGVLSDGTQYFKHGYGCAVKYRGGSVDFDFGERGEISGFCASRLWAYARAKGSDYSFATESEVESKITEAASAGELKFSGYILYYINDTAL